MNSIQEQIALLTVRIQDLAAQQDVFKAKLMELNRELDQLKAKAAAENLKPVQENIIQPVAEEKQPVTPVTAVKEVQPPVIPLITAPQAEEKRIFVPPKRAEKPASEKSGGLEEFLGKNLASKVGILVTVIGIFIGAKYALEHDLISEKVRIILGYLCGATLIGLAYRLKNKYAGYSAVLMGGGLCVLYFITYIAWSYYNLFPRMVAFGVMVGVTVATVYAATMYNRVIIAHLALIGAYAIPFLLSNNSGNYIALFSYIAIINAGIVVVAFLRNWKSLTWAAFVITWFIFAFWALLVHDEPNFKTIAWIFLSIFAALFYVALLAYKLVRKEVFQLADTLLFFPNSFIFYIGGMQLLDAANAPDWKKGCFTLLNAAIHFAVAVVVKKMVGSATPLFQILKGMVISFLAIAVPVFFDSYAIPLVWMAQAMILYVMARSQKIRLYLHFSMILTLLVWMNLFGLYSGILSDAYNQSDFTAAFANKRFLTVMVVLAAAAVMLWLNRNKYQQEAKHDIGIVEFFYKPFLPALVIFTLYGSIFWEIWRWFDNISTVLRKSDGSFGLWLDEVELTGYVTLLLYTFAFLLALVLVNQRRFKMQTLHWILLVTFILTALVWMISGLQVLNYLAKNYFDKGRTGVYFGARGFLSRYVIAAVITALMLRFQPKFSDEANRETMKTLWSILLVLLMVVFLSFEYLLWTSVSGANRQYTYGLSVVWGLFALALIIYGIWKKHRIFRITAMILLVVTLIKLVFFDLSHANTLTRTITYIALGGILLLISYLYNRYKELLFGEDQKPEAD
ncbi:DUF2339 domain-containing protein [Pseudoflavitalea sp. G-6-1-2]|uniref:DUF2339 domain-containing protein n=1 Tax=Pseudoflavitalea sp. G-6-1-2 TaxID=2728841 RepID=UPI00146A46D1|nr:DUF2339 domain-containing protein [Pseudoflavitalea sp. G-6-1-2]NML22827.1 DUF2339 domain-containing protein [Pseudoflavitalea sp. G-6-1-2]